MLDKKHNRHCTQCTKGWDNTLFKASVYVRLQKADFFSVVFLERKHRSWDLPPYHCLFLLDTDLNALGRQCEAHCHSHSGRNYYRSHCFTFKAWIQVPELRLSRWVKAMKNIRGSSWVSVGTYLDDFINHRKFSAHTHSHTHTQGICIYFRCAAETFSLSHSLNPVTLKVPQSQTTCSHRSYNNAAHE